MYNSINTSASTSASLIKTFPSNEPLLLVRLPLWLSLYHQVSWQNFTRKNMVSQNRGQLFLVLWLYKCVYGSFRQPMHRLMVNTVKGPSELKVPTRSAAVTAATKVLNEPWFTAVSTIFIIQLFCSMLLFFYLSFQLLLLRF
jgi:hypothetical protein